jgi:hypothetical protein
MLSYGEHVNSLEAVSAVMAGVASVAPLNFAEHHKDNGISGVLMGKIARAHRVKKGG